MDGESTRFASGMNIMLALWQVLSPLTLGYAGSLMATLDAVIIGLVILALSGFRMMRPTRSVIPSWVNFLLGAWLIASPFLLGFAALGEPKWNDIIVGLAVSFFALVGLLTGSAA